LVFIKGVIVGLLASAVIWQGHRLLTTPGATTSPTMSPTTTTSTTGGSLGDHRAEPPPPALAESSSAAARPGSATTAALPNRQRAREVELQARQQPVGAPSVAVFAEPSEAQAARSAERQSQLKEEAELLRRARAHLRAGELAATLALLETSRRRFAAPELSQERESLMIELLFRRGETAAAAARARRFIAAFPESPHAGRLKSFIQP
jgi:hypothetical protein